MGCAACSRPLNVLRERGRLVYQHPVRPADGHEPQAIPLAQVSDPAWVCDFCSASDPLWSYEFDGVAVLTVSGDDLAVDANHLGHRWAACAACAVLIDTGDQAGLTRRSLHTLLREHGVRDPGISMQITLLHRRLLQGGRRPTRQPLRGHHDRIGPQADPGRETGRPLPPALMPRIRDRLADYWRQEARHDLTTAISGGFTATMPSHLVSGAPAEEPATRVAAPDAATLDAYLALMAHHIAHAPLYWIDPDYTTLATHAGTGLPDLNVGAHELPTTHGLLIWAVPISHHQIPSAHRRLPIVAAHWGSTPGGVWVVFYTLADLLHPTDRPAQLQQLRERFGWLAPAHTGLALRHGQLPDAPAPDERVALSTLVATWLLAAQPDADTVAIPADKAIRRAYARTGRADPTIRVLRLRPRPQPHASPEDAANQPGRVYRHRWWVNLSVGESGGSATTGDSSLGRVVDPSRTALSDGCLRQLCGRDDIRPAGTAAERCGDLDGAGS
jgi:hypothetical protein